MNKIIAFALAQRLFFSLLALVLLGFGIKSYQELPVDAFPDITPEQVVIYTESVGNSAEDIEKLILSNVLFGTRLLEASVKSNTQWFINTGTFWQNYQKEDVL